MGANWPAITMKAAASASQATAESCLPSSIFLMGLMIGLCSEANLS